MEIFGFIVIVIAGIVGVIVTWKVSNFFLSRRDFYWNSPYKILLIKVGWCISIFLTILIIGFELLNEWVK